MSANNSLISVISHVFRDVIIEKRKSFLIVYSLLLLSSFLPPIPTYFLFSGILNIVLVYLYLSHEDALPLDKLKQAIKESFFNVFKIMIVNIVVVAALVSLGLGIYSVFKSQIVVIASLPIAIFIIGIVSFSIIHSIIGNVGPTIAIRRGIYTTRNNFWLTFRLILLFILSMTLVSSELFIVNFMSLILQLSLISIVVNSVNLGK